MLKKIGVGLAALLVVLGIVVAVQPSTYRVERKITINAGPEAVFAHLEDMKAWAAWSPWDKLDPNMQKTFEGPAKGVGASYTWSGNDDVGKGRMTITAATAPTSVTYKLEFIEPFASVAETGFTLSVSGSQTTVTWAMNGSNDFMGKAFGLVMDMDAMIGADFERGLGTLKGVVEGGG